MLGDGDFSGVIAKALAGEEQEVQLSDEAAELVAKIVETHKKIGEIRQDLGRGRETYTPWAAGAVDAEKQEGTPWRRVKYYTNSKGERKAAAPSGIPEHRNLAGRGTRRGIRGDLSVARKAQALDEMLVRRGYPSGIATASAALEASGDPKAGEALDLFRAFVTSATTRRSSISTLMRAMFWTLTSAGTNRMRWMSLHCGSAPRRTSPSVPSPLARRWTPSPFRR